MPGGDRGMARTADTTGRGHPISLGLSRIEDELKTLRDQPAWSMSPAADPGPDGPDHPPDRRGRRARSPGRRPRPDGRGRGPARVPPVPRTGRPTPPSRPGAAAHRKTQLATALASPRRTSRSGSPWRTGRVLVDQAEVIVAAVDVLPADLDPAVWWRRPRRRWSGTPSTTTRRRCGSWAGGSWTWSPRRWARPMRPGCWSRRSGRPAAAASFTMVEDGHGRCHGRFTVPSAARGDAAQAAPRDRGTQAPRPASTAPRPSRAVPRRTRWVRRSGSTSRATPPTRAARRRVSATVVVTMTVDTLMGGLKAAQLDTGHPDLTRPWPAAGLRAGIIPAVLGGASQVLDLGRKTPLPHQAPADRPRPSNRRLHRRGLRRPTRTVPRPPRPARGARAARPTTPTAGCCAPPPRQSPRPRLRDHQAPRREGPLPPTDVRSSRPEGFRLHARFALLPPRPPGLPGPRRTRLAEPSSVCCWGPEKEEP